MQTITVEIPEDEARLLLTITRPYRHNLDRTRRCLDIALHALDTTPVSVVREGTDDTRPLR